MWLCYLCNIAIVVSFMYVYTPCWIFMYTNVANNSTNDGGDDGGDGGLSTGDIIGVVFGVIASIAAVVGVISTLVGLVKWYLKHKKRTRGNCLYN